MKITVFYEILQNVTDKPDVQKCHFFDTFSTLFRQNCQKPRGLDRGYGHHASLCPRVVSISESLVKKCQFCTFLTKIPIQTPGKVRK